MRRSPSPRSGAGALAALALGLALTACRATEVVPEPPGPAPVVDSDPTPVEKTEPDLWPTVVDHPWRLFRLDGGPAVGQRAGLELGSGGDLRGHGGVNWLNGTWKRAGDQGLSFGPIGSTRMASDDPALTRQERQVLRALARVDGWRLEDERLALTQNGRTVLLFVEGPYPQ